MCVNVSYLCRVGGANRVTKATGASIVMDQEVVTVATALEVLFKEDEVAGGEAVGVVASIDRTTRKGGAPTKSVRVTGRSTKVSVRVVSAVR